MNNETILRLLQNSGLHVHGMDADFIYLEDPTCVIRSFEVFAEYAWMIITIFTGLMLLGWALSMIRGAKNDIFSNLKNLILIFGIVSLVGPIINVLYGDDLFALGCRTVRVPVADAQEVLAARQKKLPTYANNDLYENLEILDSGIVIDTPVVSVPVEEPIQEPIKQEPPEPTSVPPAVAPAAEPEIELPPTPVANTGPSQARTGTTKATFASVTGKRRITYQYPDTSAKIHIDGTPAWRNSNAGNIIVSTFARNHGAIGEGGRFAVFPDDATGMAAIKALLKTNSYRNLTIAQAIEKWAPSDDNNDVPAYHRSIERQTGLSINRRIRDLSDAELDKIANAIRRHEGWKAGDIEYQD